MRARGSEAGATPVDAAGTSPAADQVWHIESENIKTGARTRMTGYPMSKRQCIAMKGKITEYRWRRLVIVPVPAG